MADEPRRRDGHSDGSENDGPKHEEWLTRHCSHALGSTMFLLPYAMAHTGLGLFIFIMAWEAFLSRQSLLYIAEMVGSQARDENSEEVNYFAIVEKYLPAKLRLVPKFIFTLDVVFLCSFYFKVVGLLYEYLLFEDGAPENVRSGYHNQAFFAVAAFVIIYDLWERFQRSAKSHDVTNVNNANTYNIKDSKIGEVKVNLDEHRDRSHESRQQHKKEEKAKINMEAVIKEMAHYAKRRPILLLLCMLGTCQQLSITLITWKDEELHGVKNANILCPGLFKPISWYIFNNQTLLAFPIMKFLLMNYSVMLPVCTKELRLPLVEYKKLTKKAHIILTGFTTLFAFLVYFILQESVPPLFPVVYGRNVYGQMLVVLALAMTVVAILLRFMACFRLVQVLLFNSDTENMYLAIVGIFFFSSFVVTKIFRNLMPLAILAGSVTCNLLTVIIPSLAYILYSRERNQRSVWSFEVITPFVIVTFHLCMLVMAAVYVFQADDPDTNAGCRKVFTAYWQE